MAISAPIDREQGIEFIPKFDDFGLMAAVCVHEDTREVLMLAFMNEEALAKTRTTQLAHFYSRSRKKLWLKGESSGHFLHVQEIRVDCDQDSLVLIVRPDGPACHTGAPSCYYRQLNGDTLSAITT